MRVYLMAWDELEHLFVKFRDRSRDSSLHELSNPYLNVIFGFETIEL